jgi:predicted Ser/Thr protein kinase
MIDGPTPQGERSGTRHWQPCAPDVEELERTFKWTAREDDDIESRWESASLQRGQLLPGTRLRIEAFVGEGTTAMVYRGHHVDLGRPLAIKVLKDLDPDDTVRERFLAEARLTSELDSEHVVDVLDFGRLEDGRLYYAMAYLEGQPLDEVLEDGPLPLARAVPLLRMACKGLQDAHDKGIVHRDIKPENMIVVRRRNREHLVLVDFGIATASGSSEGRVCGTPYTMAPEQIEARAVDARTDVYALGCCAFQMLTGRPFAAGTTLTATLAKHLSDIREQIDPEHGVPRSISRVIHRCLALDPADRYESARELEAALCEAQIEAGLVGAGKDLPPPDVEEARRDRICAALVRGRRQGRVLKGGAAGIATGVVVALFGWRLAAGSEPIPQTFERAAPRVVELDARVLEVETLPAESLRAEVVAPAKAQSHTKPARTHRARRRVSRHRAPPRPAPDVVRSLVSMTPPPVATEDGPQLGFREAAAVQWSARSRSRQLIEDGDRALRVGERRRAHDLYRRAARLGSRQAHRRLERLERG